MTQATATIHVPMMISNSPDKVLFHWLQTTSKAETTRIAKRYFIGLWGYSRCILFYFVLFLAGLLLLLH